MKNSAKNKMVEIKQIISVIINGLNYPVKRYRLSDFKEKKNLAIC